MIQSKYKSIDLPMEEIKLLCETGATVDELAKAYGCSKRAINFKLHEYGIVRKRVSHRKKKEQPLEDKVEAIKKALEQPTEEPVKIVKRKIGW
jgi:Zn-dependent peptidase ImmA (M78 family)